MYETLVAIDGSLFQISFCISIVSHFGLFVDIGIKFISYVCYWKILKFVKFGYFGNEIVVLNSATGYALSTKSLFSRNIN